MIQISPARGARFYNMADQAVWMEQMKIVLTDEQRPSVTTVLEVWPKGKEFYEWLASRMDYKQSLYERDQGGERGSRVHDTLQNMAYGDTYSFLAYAEQHFNDDLENAVPEWKMIEAFQDWYTDWGSPTIVDRRDGRAAIECTLYSWQHGTAGTTDVVYTGGRFGTKRIMVDYKTGKRIYDSFWAQLAAYFVMWHEMGEIPLDGIGVWRPNPKKDCGYDFVVIDDKRQIEEWFNDFLAAYRLWNRHRDAQKLPRRERLVVEVRDSVKIGKLAQRPLESRPAWAMPEIKEPIPKQVLINDKPYDPTKDANLPAGKKTTFIPNEGMFGICPECGCPYEKIELEPDVEIIRCSNNKCWKERDEKAPAQRANSPIDIL